MNILSFNEAFQNVIKIHICLYMLFLVTYIMLALDVEKISEFTYQDKSDEMELDHI